MLRFKVGDRVTSIRNAEKEMGLKMTIIRVIEDSEKHQYINPSDYDVLVENALVHTTNHVDGVVTLKDGSIDINYYDEEDLQPIVTEPDRYRKLIAGHYYEERMQLALTEYRARDKGELNGKKYLTWDKKKLWLPDEDERRSCCCEEIFQVTRKHWHNCYGVKNHCRTIDHVAHLFEVKPDDLYTFDFTERNK